MKEALCKAFCAALSVQEVTAGWAVGTPFKRGDDALAYYIIRSKKNGMMCRLEDDGLTMPYLQAAGVDFTTGPRASNLKTLQDDFGVSFDVVEAVFHTPYMQMVNAPAASLRFIEFLIRMQDFLLVTRERVEDAFRADVFQSVMERFKDRAKVELHAAPSQELHNYVADMIIAPAELPPLALYVGNTDAKALEAVVLQQKTIIDSLSCNVMLVTRSAKPKRVRERTLAIARSDIDLPVAVFPEDKEGALKKMEKILFGRLDLDMFPQHGITLQ